MANNINNQSVTTKRQNRPALVFDTSLAVEEKTSLQDSITSLSKKITQDTESSQNSTNENKPEILNSPVITTTKLSSTTSSRSGQDSRIRNKTNIVNNSDQITKVNNNTNEKIDREGQSRRRYGYGVDLTVKDPTTINPLTPKIQVPGLERRPIGSDLKLPDGTNIITTKNKDGSISERTISSDGSTVTKTFQDFPPDKDGNPTGFRTTVVDNNYNVKVLSTIITKLGNGSFATVTTNITDPSNPVSIMSSALVKNNIVKDDDGNNLYDSNTSLEDGSKRSVSFEILSFEDEEALRRPTGYKSTINFTNKDGVVTTTKTESISYTDENGNRITKVFDITNPDSIVEISTSSRPDPFISKKTTGTEISNMLDKVNQWGLLDITGDGKLDPSSDLILISRYLQGLRGAELVNNVNLGQNPRTVANLESTISSALNRGLLDIVGSTSVVDKNDFKILARYMMGARGEILLDKKSAMDDNIKINPQGSNVLTMDETSPLLPEIQMIFGVRGKKLEVTNSNGLKQNYNLFFVDTVNPS